MPFTASGATVTAVLPLAAVEFGAVFSEHICAASVQGVH